MTRHYATWAVLAGAYRGKDIEARELLTHTVEIESEHSLCRVKYENLTDAGDSDLEPTCPTCRRRDPRFTTDVNGYTLNEQIQANNAWTGDGR